MTSTGSSSAPSGPPVRVYLPATPAVLARALATGRVEAPVAHAVTPALREWYVGGDLEELELAALTDAAQASLALIAAERDAEPPEPAAHPDQPAGQPVVATPRRLVVVADAPVQPAAGTGAPPWDGVGERPTGRSAVRLAGDVPWSAVVSLHVDEAEAVPDVAAAVLALPGAAAGEEDALHAVEDAEARDLLWYDATEARALLADLTESTGG